MHVRDRAKTDRVLHTPGVARVEQAAPCEQPAQLGGACLLLSNWMSGLHARVKRRRVASKALEAQRHDHLRRGVQPTGVVICKGGTPRAQRVAAAQRKTVLRRERNRRETCALESNARR